MWCIVKLQTSVSVFKYFYRLFSFSCKFRVDPYLEGVRIVDKRMYKCHPNSALKTFKTHHNGVYLNRLCRFLQEKTGTVTLAVGTLASMVGPARINQGARRLCFHDKPDKSPNPDDTSVAQRRPDWP